MKKFRKWLSEAIYPEGMKERNLLVLENSLKGQEIDRLKEESRMHQEQRDKVMSMLSDIIEGAMKRKESQK